MYTIADCKYKLAVKWLLINHSALFNRTFNGCTIGNTVCFNYGCSYSRNLRQVCIPSVN